MGNVSKYEGGSKSKSFRLPAKHFDEAKATIEAYLRRFESKPALNNKIGWPVTPEEAFIDKGTKIIEALPDFLKKPPAIVFSQTTGGDYIGGIDPLSAEEEVELYNREHPDSYSKIETLTIQEAKDKFDFDFLQTATRVPDGVHLSGKEYYDLNMANVPSDKMKELFLAATPGEPEKRIPDTLKKKLKEIDPNIIIPKDENNL